MRISILRIIIRKMSFRPWAIFKSPNHPCPWLAEIPSWSANSMALRQFLYSPIWNGRWIADWRIVFAITIDTLPRNMDIFIRVHPFWDTKILKRVDPINNPSFSTTATRAFPCFGFLARVWLGNRLSTKANVTHGWPSFRDHHVNWKHVRCLANGECISRHGTHLGHIIPDAQGKNRYCINLVSIAGYPTNTNNNTCTSNNNSSSSPKEGMQGEYDRQDTWCDIVGRATNCNKKQLSYRKIARAALSTKHQCAITTWWRSWCHYSVKSLFECPDGSAIHYRDTVQFIEIARSRR